MSSVRRIGGRVAGAALAAVLMSACGFGSSAPAAGHSSAPPAGKTHAHHRRATRRQAAYRIVGVTASSVTLQRGHRAQVTVSTTVPVYFEGARVSAGGWLRTGERVRVVGATSSPSLLALLPTAIGTVQQASSHTLTITTAKHKSVTVSLPSTYPTGDTVDVGQAVAVGSRVAVLATRTKPAALVGLAGVPTVVHGTLVSKSGSTVVVSVGGKDTAPLPFLGPSTKLAHLTAGKKVAVLETPAGAPLAAQ